MNNSTFFKKMKPLLLCALTGGMSLPATVYAQPVATVMVGSGTSTTTSPPNPYYTTWYGNKEQFLIRASELTALGCVAGTINGIGFDVQASSGAPPLSSFTVKMKNTTVTALTTTFETGLTQVTTTGTYTIVGNSINVHTLSTPFVWDGTSNLLIETCFNNTTWAGSTSIRYSTTTFNSSHYDYYDNSNQCASPSGIYNYTSMSRPNIQLQFVVPPNNVGATAITEPAANLDFCSGVKEIKARIHNYGSNTVSGVTVNWKVNGVLQTPVTYTDMIDMENTTNGPDAIVSLGNWDFPYATAQNIKVWTSMPNGVQDTKTDNDSAAATITASLLGINDLQITPRDTTICANATVTFDAGSHPKNPIYIWNNGTLTQTNTVPGPGAISVKVQNTDGCFARDTVHVNVTPLPVVNSIAIIDNGDGSFTFNVIGAQNITHYEWNFHDGSNPVVGNGMPGQQIHTFTAPGEYNVEITLGNDCGDIVTTRLIKIDGTTAIDELSALQKELKVFPNPGKETVTISQSGNVKMSHVEIYSIMGQKIYASDVTGEKHQVNVAAFASGLYNVVIDTNKGKVTKKLEIAK